MFLQTRGVNQRAQSPYGATLFPNHLAHVTLGHAHLDTRSSIALNLAHIYCVRLIDESFDNHFDGVAHEFMMAFRDCTCDVLQRRGPSPPAKRYAAGDSAGAALSALAACLINWRTVSVGCAPFSIQ